MRLDQLLSSAYTSYYCGEFSTGVDYSGGQVSDAALRCTLERISDALGQPLIVTSGDRGRIVNGNATSHHLTGRAADFYVPGMSLEDAYDAIRQLDFVQRDYQLILHSQATVSPHLHLGRYGTGQLSSFIIDSGTILDRR